MKTTPYRILAVLILFAAFVGIALIAYNAGVANASVSHVQTSGNQSGSQPYPFYAWQYWHPFPFLGFGFFGLFAFIFLAFLAIRILFGGGHFGRRKRYDPNTHWDTSEGIPPAMAEMHRRMHAAEAERGSDQFPQK